MTLDEINVEEGVIGLGIVLSIVFGFDPRIRSITDKIDMIARTLALVAPLTDQCSLGLADDKRRMSYVALEGEVFGGGICGLAELGGDCFCILGDSVGVITQFGLLEGYGGEAFLRQLSIFICQVFGHGRFLVAAVLVIDS